ncbi:YdeI/OmpD-associated family protein [Paenibacillus koleovorans]|uniref:YdeI/OmpD-associated family protein n=1 Tax=Paenibacillus koleovorans TaxID=121608 RepID=UPI0013E3A966|nr:YdeI/OmpD-associated family protein [Paenibacillus koleovorans]
MSANKQSFESILVRPPGTGTWTYLIVPFNAEAVYGSKGQIKVKGTVGGVPFRSTLMPSGGEGGHYMVVNRDIRDALGVSAGDAVQVELELDTAAREVTVPAALQEALDADEEAGQRFEKLSYSHKKEYVDWIESARKAETRASRIEKALGMLKSGTRLKG